ncbi:uncharacterized protein LOC130725637 [Lotus japonicus]|uniref:uncharacterized protein LOC130725637 n=1 Tax=Lotus japonicus TaxID=34305 RepID=UPI00258FFBB5|nr:uncharacterized protein LOC130725637 [Lotus japonicus]
MEDHKSQIANGASEKEKAQMDEDRISSEKENASMEGEGINGESSASQRVDGMQNTLQEDLELERQLKLINKPPVKSIQTKFGYIVDCIDINKQPAFDHPLLKNHKLQRKPSNQKTIENSNLRNSPSKPKFGLEKPCPKGTVPIRRTTKNNLVQAKSLLDNQILAQQDPTYRTHVAEVNVLPLAKGFQGVNGTSSVWQPIVEKDQSSAALTWVRNGPLNATNEIVAGWHVAPQLYNGDVGTHLFAQWTVDTFQKTGCYNVLCSGYMQTDHSYYLGGSFHYTSDRNNIVQFQVGITQDPITKDWWLNVENTNIGYFPAELFTNLASANQVGWGGATTTHVGTPSPPMGSGLFPDEDMHGASYFRWLSFKNENEYTDITGYSTEAFADNPDCYWAKFYGYHKNIGSILQFGGPGGKCDN